MTIRGRAHLQTVSIFPPLLERYPTLADVAYRHPSLDFASTHFYEEGTIDHPRDTIAAAISTGRLARDAVGQTPPGRPFFDNAMAEPKAARPHPRDAAAQKGLAGFLPLIDWTIFRGATGMTS